MQISLNHLLDPYYFQLKSVFWFRKVALHNIKNRSRCLFKVRDCAANKFVTICSSRACIYWNVFCFVKHKSSRTDVILLSCNLPSLPSLISKPHWFINIYASLMGKNMYITRDDVSGVNYESITDDIFTLQSLYVINVEKWNKNVSFVAHFPTYPADLHASEVVVTQIISNKLMYVSPVYPLRH